jgi:hypothetical protein
VPPSEPTRLDLALAIEQASQCGSRDSLSEPRALLVFGLIEEIIARGEAGEALLALVLLTATAVRDENAKNDEENWELVLRALGLDGESLCPEPDQLRKEEP